MVDFTNNSQDVMNIDSVISLFARMNRIYNNIIGQLVDTESPEIADFLEENMPALNDYILEVCCASDCDPVVDYGYYNGIPGLPIDMEELYDLCDFFDFDPEEIFILEDES